MSLINDQYQENHVEFVSYTGRYPNLCDGILTLKINGVEYEFGHNYEDRFWESGGGCRFIYDGGGEYLDSCIETNEWIIDVERIPEHLRQYAAEIDEVFNTNVEHGCCGGCL